MRKNHSLSAIIFIRLTLSMFATMLVACGSGTSSTTTSNTTTTTTTTSSSTTASSTTSSTIITSRGSGTLTTIPTATGNSISLVVDAGPVSGQSSINVPYVSVTVCTPGTTGTTAACQTIDHVLVDTGSYGLRLLNSALSSSLNLPAVTSNSKTIAECTPFVIGTTWGSVRLADIYIGGEVALSIPIQDIGDAPGGYASVPSDCASTGTIQNTLSTLGANGILGIGTFINDCDVCLTTAISAAYYTCSSSGCSNSTVTSAQVVRNPVASFAQDNNGTLIDLPAVPSSGSSGVTGSLIFGIGTSSNNSIPSSAGIYKTNAYGNFTTVYKGVTMSSSYLDSGSNGFFFNDSTITLNAWGWYSPTGTLTLSATNASSSGNPSIAVSFSLVNIATLSSNIVAANVGGSGSSGVFAWGLPFYYGRPVFTAISGKSTPSGTGPFWAY